MTLTLAAAAGTDAAATAGTDAANAKQMIGNAAIIKAPTAVPHLLIPQKRAP